MKKKIRPEFKIFKVETEIKRDNEEVIYKRGNGSGFNVFWEPAMDVYEKDKEVVVEAEVPGIPVEHLQIVQWGNRLEISGVKKEELKAKKFKFHRLEREMGFFCKEIVLPVPIRPEKTVAVLENGVLTIRLKKASVNKEIEVKIRKSKEENGGK
ncbi:MAG TPA: Hsp20/alpha crystallin family protein [Candidatus Saccharicenans sp.]|jgi:HSP20 family protein|nr:Hsp20/alpha crystallin family protein [Candidatus Saccharicenans sp.]HRD01745.1 Hsp20/alpha crystallin family protein [Candidatus Saccharicenans sp.]